MGAFITGPGGSNTQAVTRYDGLQVGMSQLAVPLPILWGQRRISYNCVWYNNFKAHKQSSKGKGKGGGGKGKNGQYTYTAAVILALCEGVVDSILNVWANGSTTTTTTLSDLGMTFYDGDAAQTPPSFITTKYPDQALSYALTSYMFAPNLDLGASASVPENAFEAKRLNGFTDTLTTSGWTNPTTHVNTPGVDVSLADVIPDFLTNDQYGALGFVAGDIPDMSFFRSYQDAQGLYFSPFLTSQEIATDIIDRWAQMANSWIYWAGTQFMFVPLGDSVIGGYTPALEAAYDLGIGDFLDDPPITVTRIDPADAHNRTVVQFTDRTMGYVSNSREYKDQTLVDQYGTRDDSSTQFDEICVPEVAEKVVYLLGRRNAYIRNTYKFRTNYKFIRIMPGTIVTLTDPNIGLNKFRVRVTKVDEDEDLNLSFESEELPPLIGTYFPPPGTPGTWIPTFPDSNTDPGNVNTPCVAEPDSSFTAGTAQLLITASGASANWGGAVVFVGFPGSSSFLDIGEIAGQGVQGLLTANLPNHTDPDTVDTLSVDMTESFTEPQPVTNDDADSLRTLMYLCAQPTVVGPDYVLDPNGELGSFGNTTTTGTYSADLTYLRRGQLGTSPAAHSTGDQFSMLDTTGVTGTTLLYNLPPQYIGTAIKLKFCSKNSFGRMQQDLSSVVEYQYTPTGRGYGGGTGGVPTTPATPTVAAGAGQNVISWAPNPSSDNVTSYDLYIASGLSQPFSSATKVWSGQSTSYIQTAVAAGAQFTYFVVANNKIGASTHSAGANGTVGTAIYLPLTGGALSGPGNLTMAGYLGVGSTSPPTNANAGDLTAKRLFMATASASGFTTAFGWLENSAVPLTNTAAGAAFGFRVDTHLQPGSASSAEFRILSFGGYLDGTNNFNFVEGGYFENRMNASGNVAQATGVKGIGITTSSATVSFGTIAAAHAFEGRSVQQSSGTTATGTITEAVDFYAPSPTFGANITITTQYGLLIDQQKVTNVGKGYGVYQKDVGDLNVFAGRATIGAAADPTASAALDVNSTTGAVLFPRMTTTQKLALTPTAGMVVQDTTLGALSCYEGGAWGPLGGGSTGANPTATASDVAVNGVATTFMRSDAAPAIQLATAAQFGIVKVDGTTITSSGGVISATGGGGGSIGAAGGPITVMDNLFNGSGAWATNDIILRPIYLNAGDVVTALGIFFAATNAAANWKVGMYSGDLAGPTSLVAVSPNQVGITANVASIYTFPSSIAITTSGIYWVGAWTDTSTAVWGNSNSRQAFWVQSGGVWPSSAPAFSTNFNGSSSFAVLQAGGNSAWAWTTSAAASASGSATACKCTSFVAAVGMSIDAISGAYDTVAGATYRHSVYQIDNTGKILSIVADSANIASPGTLTRQVLTSALSSVAVLTAGNQYAVALRRTDGGDTYVFPTYGSNAAGCQMPALPAVWNGSNQCQFGTLAKANPAINDMFSLGNGIYTLGVRFKG